MTMNNIIGGMKAYHVFCRKCNWSKDITVHKDFTGVPEIISKLLVFINPCNPIPNKCPKCNSKTEKYENKHIVF